MQELIPDALLQVLSIAIIYSVIQTAIVEWIKQSKIINNTVLLWLLNTVICLVVGSCFAMYFFQVDVYSAVWSALFAAVGAAGIYKSLIKTKNQLAEVKEQQAANINSVTPQVITTEVKGTSVEEPQTVTTVEATKEVEVEVEENPIDTHMRAAQSTPSVPLTGPSETFDPVFMEKITANLKK